MTPFPQGSPRACARRLGASGMLETPLKGTEGGVKLEAANPEWALESGSDVEHWPCDHRQFLADQVLFIYLSIG